MGAMAIRTISNAPYLWWSIKLASSLGTNGLGKHKYFTKIVMTKPGKCMDYEKLKYGCCFYCHISYVSVTHFICEFSFYIVIVLNFPFSESCLGDKLTVPGLTSRDCEYC